MAGLDTQALERELAGHSTFGDTRAILDRTRTHALMQLEALSRSRPFARELWRELHKQGGRRAAADILDDPVVRRSSRSLLRAIRRGERSTSDEAEEVFAAVLQHLRHGPPGLPVAAGCPHRFRSGRSGQSITVWDPGVPETAVTRTFSAFVDDCFSEHYSENRTKHLQRPEPAFVDSLRRAYDLLAILLPELSASALDHIRLVGVLCNQRPIGIPSTIDLRCVTFVDIPSTTFIAGVAVNTPWRAAEYLLHEALHQKMADTAIVRSIYRPDFQAEAPTIRAIWRRAHGPLADWTLDRAWNAFHIYVHLACFFARVERMAESLAEDFGTPSTPGHLGLGRMLARAGYLGEELAAHAERFFGSDGREFFAWLRRMLSCFCDADALRAHVARLRGDCAGSPQ